MEDSVLNRNVMNVCQDVVYAKSKGKILTPKHIGIGLTMHHETRFKWPVNLLHAAGCSISYELTFQYWINYLKMINTLLNFVKAERLGLWHVHLSAFEDASTISCARP